MDSSGLLLKACLPAEGMRWKARDYVLRTPRRDRRILQALRQKGVGFHRTDIETELCSVMDMAKTLACRGEARTADDSYDFVLSVRRRHRLGRILSQRLFLELFRAIVNAGRRNLRIANMNWGNQNVTQLAIAVDAFLREAGVFYRDSEVFLRLNEETE